MTDLRLILAARTAGLPESLNTHGFVPMTGEEIMAALEGAGLWFGPRTPLETDESFRQIIPYLIIRVDGKVVAYTRAPKGGEIRLHGKVSVGLGGHIDLPDAAANADGHLDIARTLDLAAARELAEELGAHGAITDAKWVGMLVANATDVDRVHIGAVALWDVESIPAEEAEDAVTEIRLLTHAEISAEADRLETWTALMLPWLKDQIA